MRIIGPKTSTIYNNEKLRVSEEELIEEHNTSKIAHNDIRLLIEALSAADSDIISRITSANKTALNALNSSTQATAKADQAFSQAEAAETIGTSAQNTANDALGAANTVQQNLNTHNTDVQAHEDFRLELKALSDRINAVLDSDDETLDEMSEVVAYIKSNKTLIDSITTSKVSVSDIIDNLTTNVSNKPLSAAQGVVLKALIESTVSDHNSSSTAHNDIRQWLTSLTSTKIGTSDIINDLTTNESKKPLSAAQGVALKALIDAITVPTKVSAFVNDKGYLTSFTESDPTVPAWAKASSKPSYTKSEVGLGNVDNAKQYSASNPPPYPVTSVNGQTGAVVVSVPTKLSELSGDSTHRTVTDEEKTAWNNKSNFSGAYADLTGNPTIPSKTSQLINDSNFAVITKAETWTFTLADGSTVTKKVVLA